MSGSVDGDGEEQAWRDLVAQFSAPAAEGAGPAPWPAREDLGARPPTSGRPPGRGPTDGRPTDGRPTDGRPTDSGPGDSGPTDGGPTDGGGAGSGGLASTSAGGGPIRPDAGNSAGPRPGEREGVAGRPRQPRIIRPAQPPAPSSPSAPADPEDEGHYVPPPPPPLPRVDPVTKGAWAAVVAGPGYLLVAVLMSWWIPGWAAFCAVGAFIGGFAALVARMGDRPPPQDSGPDDGAVV